MNIKNEIANGLNKAELVAIWIELGRGFSALDRIQFISWATSLGATKEEAVIMANIAAGFCQLKKFISR